jgi:hypothetical protein
MGVERSVALPRGRSPLERYPCSRTRERSFSGRAIGRASARPVALGALPVLSHARTLVFGSSDRSRFRAAGRPSSACPCSRTRERSFSGRAIGRASARPVALGALPVLSHARTLVSGSSDRSRFRAAGRPWSAVRALARANARFRVERSVALPRVRSPLERCPCSRTRERPFLVERSVALPRVRSPLERCPCSRTRERPFLVERSVALPRGRSPLERCPCSRTRERSFLVERSVALERVRSPLERRSCSRTALTLAVSGGRSVVLSHGSGRP